MSDGEFYTEKQKTATFDDIFCRICTFLLQKEMEYATMETSSHRDTETMYIFHAPVLLLLYGRFFP
jgi:hypothetical protein